MGEIPDTLTITLTDDEFRKALRLAEQTLRVFAKMPGYYNNNLNSHLRGKVGEIASARWLKTNGVSLDPLFCDVGNLSQCDIVAKVVRSLRLDVKTWDRKYWPEMGRCIAAKQLATLRSKADGILWCVSSSNLDAGAQVEVAGWSLMSDIEAAPRRATGAKGGRQVDNYQVDPDKLRLPADLLASLKKEPSV